MNKFFLVSLLIIITLCSCRENTPQFQKEIPLQIEVAHFSANDNNESEAQIKELKACLFTDGILTQKYENLNPENGLILKLEKNKGNLYILGNAIKSGIWENMTVGTLTEEQWVNRTVKTSMQPANSFFFAGKTSVESQLENPQPVYLYRGCARFDIALLTEKDIQVKSLKITHTADEMFFWKQGENILTPSTAQYTTKDTVFTTPLSKSTTGVMYVYEQVCHNDTKLELTLSVDGKERVESIPIGIRELKRNAFYSIRLTDNENGLYIQLQEVEWEPGEDTDLRPDLGKDIHLDAEASELDGATIGDDMRTLTIPHTKSKLIVAVSCDNELEAMLESNSNIASVEPYLENGQPVRNKFIVNKKQVAPGNHFEDAVLLFRRKGMQHIYPEDHCILKFADNPVKPEGILKFDEEGICDFNDYIDGELATFEVPEGQEVIVSFEGTEKQWIKVEPKTDHPNHYRIIAGWKPNDPLADGRNQEATIWICNKSLGSTDKKAESYRIIRKNYGLPVVQLNGIWWCKYNALGNSRLFEDQILSSNDPAAKVGKTVQEYLRECNDEEFLHLWNSAYLGNDGISLKGAYEGNQFKIQGYRSNESVHINGEIATALAPHGYQTPTLWDYQYVLSEITIPQNEAPYNPIKGEDYRCKISRYTRSGVKMDNHTLPDLRLISITGIKQGGKEPLVLYGLDCQWNNDGVNFGWLLITTCNVTDKTGWVVNNSNGIRYNKAGANNTRILRFIKSPVEYIYE